jgi:two-component system, NarL family, response regulator LiaR
MIRVLICDDQEIVCDGLEAILSTQSDIEVVAIAHDGDQAIVLALQKQPDLVLMDLKMPGTDGVQATRQIHEQLPGCKILVLTTYDADEWVFDAIRSGASGYLLKSTPRDELVAAIRGTLSGQTHVDPKIAGKLFQHVAHQEQPLQSAVLEMLNEREREILILLARGYNNSDIANELHLSIGTVKNYISAIFTKLEVEDRTQAALLALRYGLIS